MTQQKIRLGIIGVGWFAVQGHWDDLKNDDRVKVTGICRRNKELLEKAAKIMNVDNTYTDWREMLEKEKFDAVIVSTPNNYHAEPTIAALKKGINVLVEKPMALTIQDAKEMITAVEASAGKLMVGYKYRCSPNWIEAHRRVNEGAIGCIRQVSAIAIGNELFFADFSTASPSIQQMAKNEGPIGPFIQDILREGNWRGNAETAGGSMFVDMHTHTVDRMLWFSGARPLRVSCDLNTGGFPVERALTTHAELENGVLFSIAYNGSVDTKDGKGGGTLITVTGDEGLLISKEGVFAAEGPELDIISGGEQMQITSENEERGPAEMFIDYIMGECENPAPPEECAWTVALTESAYRSAKEKQVILIGS